MGCVVGSAGRGVTGTGVGVAMAARCVASGAGDDVRIGVGVAPGRGVAVGMGVAVGAGVALRKGVPVGSGVAVDCTVDVGPGIGVALAGAVWVAPLDDFRLPAAIAAAAPIASAPPTIAPVAAFFCEAS